MTEKNNMALFETIFVSKIEQIKDNIVSMIWTLLGKVTFKSNAFQYCVTP